MAETSTIPQKAIFAGGCFWCMEAEFLNQPGVRDVVSGYTGGKVKNPTYEQVSRGDTGHLEAIEVTFDPIQTSFDKLLEIYWSNIDPLDPNGQFCDKGSQYRAAIFTLNEEQRQLAEASLQAMEAKLKQPVATLIRTAETFYPAEDYHQAYAIKNPERYQRYKYGCGRPQRLEELQRLHK